MNLEAQQSLCREVTMEEVNQALRGIDDDKAPGIDGFQFFSKQHGILLKMMCLEPSKNSSSMGSFVRL